MKVYVVVDGSNESRVIGVYQSLKAAIVKACESQDYYYDEAELELENEDA